MCSLRRIADTIRAAMFCTDLCWCVSAVDCSGWCFQDWAGLRPNIACLGAWSFFLQLNVSICWNYKHRNIITKKLSYRKAIARQLRAQYVEWIYSNSMTLKSGSWVEFLLAFHSDYGAILYRLRDTVSCWSKISGIFISHRYLALGQGVTPSKFRKGVWYSLHWNDWAIMWWRSCDDTLSRFDTIPERDGQTDRQKSYMKIARQHCCADVR